MVLLDNLFSHVSGRHLALLPLVTFYDQVVEPRKIIGNQSAISEDLNLGRSQAFERLYQALDIHDLGHLKMHYNLRAFYDNYGVLTFQAWVRGQEKFDQYSLVTYDNIETEAWRQYLDYPWTNPLSPEFRYLPIKLVYQQGQLSEIKPDVWDPHELGVVRAWRRQLRQIKP